MLGYLLTPFSFGVIEKRLKAVVLISGLKKTFFFVVC